MSVLPAAVLVLLPAVRALDRRAVDRFYILPATCASSARASTCCGSAPATSSEIALLRASPHTATVVAERSVHLLALTQEAFIAAVTGHTSSRAAAEEAVVRRLAVRAEPGTL